MLSFVNNYQQLVLFSVKKDVMNDDDEGIKVKEQAILELGDLLAETKQAEGKVPQRLYKHLQTQKLKIS